MWRSAVLGVCLTIGAALTASCSGSTSKAPLLTSARFALPDQTCSPMTATDLQRANLALEVMTSFPGDAPIFNGAMDVFGYPREAFDKPAHCVTPELKREVVKRTLAAGVWDRGLPGLTRLKLAGQLGPQDPRIVQAVARVAFVDRPIEEGPFADLRPMARSVLGSFGVAAAPWREQALGAMGAKDAMETSAAQVAGASGEPAAVDKVAGLLREALNSAPADRPIPIQKGERLVELSFALGVAGPQARRHVPLLVQLLNRDVLVGSHFGPLELPPKDVCRVLRAIGGAEAMEAAEGSRCNGAV